MDNVQIEMPRYRSHKEVWALKIADVKKDSTVTGSAILIFENNRYVPIRVLYDYIQKHNPQPGGYYVVYQDGYKSWSPAEAFESGYLKING